ncbi:unnamed protein product [Sphagnum troendelagicum]|uniref:PGG domain-containing protein n=1 Tax=Sphagnum troendelagicum TaxID=128251 RepID=A0ABP0UH42_9BRYO
MASPPPENGTGETVVCKPLRAKKSEDRTDMTDVDESVKSGVSHWRKVSMQGQTANGDESSVITLMELARDGSFDHFKTAWGPFKKDCNGNSGESFVNLNRAVAVNGVKFEAQREGLKKLYNEHEIDYIFDSIGRIKELHRDGIWKTESIEKNGGDMQQRRLHVPDIIWNAYAVIYPGRTALHMAAANGQVEIVTAICETPGVDFLAKDVFGYTPLHLACYSRHENKGEVVTKLLENIDANVAAKRKGFYFTALHLAVKAKSKDIVDMLLDWQGPRGLNFGKVLDVGAKDRFGLTALHLAVTEAIPVQKALDALNSRNRKEEKLTLEKEDLKVERAIFVLMIVAIIRFMNNKSPEAINKADKNKSTPLHTTVEAGNHRLAHILLEDGDKIDPELLDIRRRTALEIAVDKRDYVMVQTLQNYLERAGIVGNHKAYADSAAAILVGAALLVTVTFAAWVQIPTNDSTLFWVFVSLSFYFAVATFLAAAGAAIPSKGSTLGFIRRAVLLSAFCLAISLACAVAAFAIAGFLIVPHGIEHRRKVIATTVIGGFVCLFCLLSFVRKILKALGLFFFWLDLLAQRQLEKYIYKPVVDGVKLILGRSLVYALKKQYDAWYTNPVRNFFTSEKDDEEEDD